MLPLGCASLLQSLLAVSQVLLAAALRAASQLPFAAELDTACQLPLPASVSAPHRCRTAWPLARTWFELMSATEKMLGSELLADQLTVF
jgi:hypothetical protein